MEQKEYDKMYQGPVQVLTIAIILYIFSLGGQVIGLFMTTDVGRGGDVIFCMILILILVLSVVMWNRQRKMMHMVAEQKC